MERLYDLCAKADVVLENFRPGVLPRLGLGYDDVSRRNPDIVYCSLSGYGQSGLYAERGAFDVTIQAASGLMSVTGEEDAGPTKCGVPIGDFVAGLYSAYSILAALRRRDEVGQGAMVDCSMLGSLLGISALQTSEYFGNGHSPSRLGSAHSRNAPYQAFLASDRHFVVAAGNEALWQKFCGIIGLPDLSCDPRFTPQRQRALNQKHLVALVAPIFRTRTADEWLEDFVGVGIPCAPVNDFGAILKDPHVAAMGLIHPISLPNGVETFTVAFPIGMSGMEFRVRRMPPMLGQDTDEVFQEWLAPVVL